MKRTTLAIMVLVAVGLTGCSSSGGSAALGAAGGAVAGAGTYEYRLHNEMNRIEDEYKAGKMDQKEYEARKDEIRRMQLIK